jgi:hypothetical protein
MSFPHLFFFFTFYPHTYPPPFVSLSYCLLVLLSLLACPLTKPSKTHTLFHALIITITNEVTIKLFI